MFIRYLLIVFHSPILIYRSVLTQLKKRCCDSSVREFRARHRSALQGALRCLLFFFSFFFVKYVLSLLPSLYVYLLYLHWLEEQASYSCFCWALLGSESTVNVWEHDIFTRSVTCRRAELSTRENKRISELFKPRRSAQYWQRVCCERGWCGWYVYIHVVVMKCS